MDLNNLKDTLAMIGILVPIGISIFSLWISLKNRSNALRESLFKEQLHVAQGIRRKAQELESAFDQWHEQLNNIELRDATNKAIEEFDNYFNANDIVLPDEIIVALNNYAQANYNFFSKTMRTQQIPSDPEMDVYIDKYYLLEDKLRYFIGVDALSEVNKTLIGNKHLSRKF